MTSLSPEARALIDAAAPEEGMDDVRRHRNKARIMGRIATGAAAGATVLATAEAAAAPAKVAVAKGTFLSLALTTALKSGAAALVVTAAVAGGYRVATGPSSSPPAVDTGRAAAPTAATAAPSARRQERPAPLPDEPPPAASAEPSPPEPVAAPPAAQPSSLARETALLQKVQAELAAGNADAALELLGEHEAEHGGGALREERRAARVLALCQSGRLAEGRAAARRFAVDYPRSPQRARVLGACAEKK
jgi:hypothetical protein